MTYRLSSAQVRALKLEKWTCYQVNPKTSRKLQELGFARNVRSQLFEITDAGKDFLAINGEQLASAKEDK